MGMLEKVNALLTLTGQAGGGVAGAYVFKGSVATEADLPDEAEVGDVYNITSDGMNYAWTGSEWDALGASASITVDTELSNASTNPVQNKVIKTALDSKADQIIFPCGVSIGSDEEKGTDFGQYLINIGKGSLAWGDGSIAIGLDAKAYAGGNVVIGQDSSNSKGGYWCNVLVGPKNTSTKTYYGVAIGAGLSLTEHGEIAIGAGDDESNSGADAAKANTIRVKGGVLTVGGNAVAMTSDIEAAIGDINSILEAL